MGGEAGIPQGLGQSEALLWLLLLNVATLELRGSPATAALAGLQAMGERGSRVSTVCGKPKVMGRIYGGRDVEAGQWLWQASLRFQGSNICGAVLINSSWLLSTAHCFLKKSKAPENYQVLLGSIQLYQHTPQTREVSVSRIITHPDFEKLHPFGSDIAMLQLLFPVNFTSYIIPACLPVPGMKLPSNSSCWITGWGMLNEESEREGKVSFIENIFCNMLYGLAKGKNFSVQEDMLCAGDFSTGKSICLLSYKRAVALSSRYCPVSLPPFPQRLLLTALNLTHSAQEVSPGDSGGPLVCDFTSSWVLMGLASWGFDCRHPIYPSIFTNITYFTDWIEEIQRLTPNPEPTSALTPLPSPRPFLHRPSFHTSLCGLPSSVLGTAFVHPQTWPLLLFLLGSLRQATW
ncbi:putative serine protease 47 [Bos mutus]|uniref:putative serine protease 47 n=1 Tax=Bos mutus TaxID=72004 RepID=UPI0038B4C6A6